jgi:hypothetical protein
MEHTPQSTFTGSKASDGLSVRRHFTTSGEHPFDAVEW